MGHLPQKEKVLFQLGGTVGFALVSGSLPHQCLFSLFFDNPPPEKVITRQHNEDCPSDIQE